MGLLFAAANTIGEYRFGKALNATDYPHAFLYFERAESIWPFKFRIREGQAMAYSNTNSIDPNLALEAINSGLENDPYSPSLLWHKVMQELRRGGMAAAWEAMKRFDQVSDNWPEGAQLHKIYKKVRLSNYSIGRHT